MRLNDTSFIRSGFCNDYNFAKTKTTKLYESKNILQGIADEACVYGLKDIDMNNIVIIRYTFPS